MKTLQKSVKKLIETNSYANFATVMPDGSPHVTQTWVDHDGEIIINTYEGSVKHRNAVRDPRVALDVCDPTAPYIMAVIRGRVREGTFNGAEEHIDRMAKKHIGQNKYPMRRPRMRRVLIKIEPNHVVPPFRDDPR